MMSEKIHTNKIAVVIPYYNASKHIAQVVKKLPTYITSVIIVDDKGKEKLPLEEVKQQLAKDTTLVVLENKKNLGVGGATKKGLQYVIENNYDIVIKIDADDQMDTTYLPQLLQPLVSKKASVTKGNRFKRTKDLQKMPIVRRFGNLGLSFLTKIATGYWNNFDPTNGFIAIRVNKLKEINFENLSHRYFFETSLMSEFYFCRARIKDITMPAIYGDEKSSMKVWKMPFIFSRKLVVLFVKRIVKTYFLYDFNIGSIYLIFGKTLFLFGLIFGLFNWISHASLHQATPTGTIMIATISLILGFQLLLQFIQYDILNAPKTIDDDEN